MVPADSVSLLPPPFLSRFLSLKQCTLCLLVWASQTQTFPLRKCSRSLSPPRLVVVFKVICTLILQLTRRATSPVLKRRGDSTLSLPQCLTFQGDRLLTGWHTFSHTWSDWTLSACLSFWIIEGSTHTLTDTHAHTYWSHQTLITVSDLKNTNIWSPKSWVCYFLTAVGF